jgi:YVTN family beta-propeller protein
MATCLIWFFSWEGTVPAAPSAWLSPTTLIATRDGNQLFVACATGERVLTVDTASRRVTRSIKVPASPSGLALSSDGGTLYVTCAAAESQVCAIDLATGRIIARWPAGHTAVAPVLAPDGKSLFVCNRFNDDVSMIEVASGKQLRRIGVRREPVAAAITRNGKHLLVANHLPHGRANGEHVGAVVSVVETASGRVVNELWLPNGSGALNDLRVSPEGKYAVVTHTLSRFALPTTQLERGWMNTSAQTLIDLDRMEVLNTVLLDSVERGAANPWGAGWTPDGQKLVVALAGTHEISVTDFAGLISKLATLAPSTLATAQLAAPYSGPGSRATSDVAHDLSFLAGLRERRQLPVDDVGPRSLVVSGRTAYVANYFSDTLTVIPLDGAPAAMASIALGPRPEMTTERRGELYFNDARLCFQNWQSCASCHPGDARVDGLNWDLLNDGMGNPKNTKSMLLAFKTPPAMSTGVRKSAEAAVRAGIRHILFTDQPPAVAEALDAYIKSLQPVASPYLEKGKLSKAAQRGQRIFSSKAAGCAECHPAPLFTDLNAHDVGTRGGGDDKADLFDTPTLIELWRTGPYLHDGSATLREVLVESNPNDRHGRTSQLNAEEINDLLQYLLSL